MILFIFSMIGLVSSRFFESTFTLLPELRLQKLLVFSHLLFQFRFDLGFPLAAQKKALLVQLVLKVFDVLCFAKHPVPISQLLYRTFPVLLLFPRSLGIFLRH